MSEHTPEPWVFTERTNKEYSRKESIKCACNIAVDQHEFSPEKTSANYRRIVLCVNSLAGVPDELLKDDDKNIISRYTEHLKKETVRQADLLAEVTAQRDELLQVLGDIAAHTDGYDGILEWACRKSLSAINKCRDEREVKNDG